MKISFCTTCKGRLAHLRKTLPYNLKSESQSVNVEFVVLDYDSNDGMGEWVTSTFENEISTGKLVYARHEPAPEFKMAHAKNMVHRIATGDILCNLDADNILSKNYSNVLRDAFKGHERAISSPRTVTTFGFLRQRYINKIIGGRRPVDGICGRIAVARSAFYELRGYDEGFSGWGADDIDFLLRARDSGLHMITLKAEDWGSAVSHSNEDRIRNLSDADKIISKNRYNAGIIKQMKAGVNRMRDWHGRSVNDDGYFGCGEVSVNRGPVQSIRPIV